MPQLKYLWVYLIILMPGLAPAQDNIIEEVLVQGNRRFPEDSIRYRIASKEGDPLDVMRVTNDIKALWATGQLDNIRVGLLEGETGGVILVFDVTELPLVVEVDYRGQRKLTKSTITDKVEEERLTITEDDVLSYQRVNAIRRLIKELLNERGLRYGTVNYTLERLDSGTARIVFNVDEGTKVKIHGIQPYDGICLWSRWCCISFYWKTCRYLWS